MTQEELASLQEDLRRRTEECGRQLIHISESQRKTDDLLKKIEELQHRIETAAGRTVDSSL